MCCIGDCTDCCVGNCSDCGGKADRILKERHEKEVAEELARYREEEAKSSKVCEEEYIKIMNLAINEFIDMIEKYNHKKYGEKQLNINISKIKEKQNILNKEIIGYIGSTMNTRLVQTDPELSIILAEMDTQKRNKNFNAFINSVKAKALNKLKDRIVVVMQEIEKIVRVEVETRLREIEKSLENASVQYKAIIDLDKKDSIQFESKKIEYMLQYDIYGLLLKEIK